MLKRPSQSNRKVARFGPDIKWMWNAVVQTDLPQFCFKKEQEEISAVLFLQT